MAERGLFFVAAGLLVFLLALFSSFSPLLVVKFGEHQPTFFFVIVLFWLYSALVFGDVRFERTFFLYYFVFVCTLLLFFLFDLKNVDVNSLKNLLILLSGPTLYMFFRSVRLPADGRLVLSVIYSLSFLSFVSLGPWNSALSSVVDPFLRILFADRSTVLPDGARGVGIFYPEPSHAAPYIVLLFSIAFMKIQARHVSRKEAVLLFLCFVVVLVANKSKTLLLMVLMQFSLYVVLKRQLSMYFLVVALFVAFCAFLYFSPDSPLGIAFRVAASLYSSGELTLDNTAQFASARFMAVYVYSVMPLHEPLGMGFTNHIYSFVDVANKLGVDYTLVYAFQEFGMERVPFNPRSYFNSVYYSLGVLGYVFALLFSLHVLGECRKESDAFLRASRLVGLFLILFMGLPVLTAPWMMLAIPRLRYVEKG